MLAKSLWRSLADLFDAITALLFCRVRSGGSNSNLSSSRSYTDSSSLPSTEAVVDGLSAVEICNVKIYKEQETWQVPDHLAQGMSIA
jgi:hypothetical protein